MDSAFWFGFGIMPRILQAGTWGLVAGLALLVGAVIGYLARVPQRLIAAVMAFGGRWWPPDTHGDLRFAGPLCPFMTGWIRPLPMRCGPGADQEARAATWLFVAWSGRASNCDDVIPRPG